jgi:hypothetical protein
MSKHPPSGHTPTALPADDLECDPGIGRSKGTTIAGKLPTLRRVKIPPKAMSRTTRPQAAGSIPNADDRILSLDSRG